MSTELKTTRRHLPHWSIDNAVYFVTFRACNDLTPEEKTIVINHIISGNKKFYTLIACVVMSNHVHLLFYDNYKISLERIMRGIKGVSARKINLLRKSTGQIWQHESYDHIIRNGKELKQKFEYIISNPIRAELIVENEHYQWLYWNEEIIL